jgi:hypothetical protein
VIRKNKSIVPDGISGEILNWVGKPLKLLDITMNNGTLPADWKSHGGSCSQGGVIDHYFRIIDQLA